MKYYQTNLDGSRIARIATVLFLCGVLMGAGDISLGHAFEESENSSNPGIRKKRSSESLSFLCTSLGESNQICSIEYLSAHREKEILNPDCPLAREDLEAIFDEAAEDFPLNDQVAKLLSFTRGAVRKAFQGKANPTVLIPIALIGDVAKLPYSAPVALIDGVIDGSSKRKIRRSKKALQGTDSAVKLSRKNFDRLLNAIEWRMHIITQTERDRCIQSTSSLPQD